MNKEIKILISEDNTLGTIFKSTTAKQNIEIINATERHSLNLDPQISNIVIDSIKTESTPSSDKKLSHRELEVLKLISEGLTKKKIANKLSIEITTVAYHVKHIYEKLSATNAPSAVSKGYQLEILPAEKC